MRMQKGVRGHSALAFDQDCDRLIALMSVAANRPVAEAEVLPHVEAAAVHWRRGDKALANLRLAVAKLPQISDQTSAYRLALAEHLLDNGWSPRGLMIELGFAAPVTGFEKYNPNHVPAGHGSRSGQFDFGPGSIAVAEVDEDENFKARQRLGETTPKEEIEHGQPITPTTGTPILGSRGAAVVDTKTLDALSTAASIAAGNVGPGRGPVYGTKVHMEFRAQVEAMGGDDLHTEQSYLNGDWVPYGTIGAVRFDAVEGPKDRPHTGYDLKTGNASLTPSRRGQLQVHAPKSQDGRRMSIYEVRP